jgi:hypothetical protein
MGKIGNLKFSTGEVREEEETSEKASHMKDTVVQFFSASIYLFI